MKKVKHDHKGTKALKLTIFFSLMLAPMLAVLFKCCYVTFNKNAYQSYNGYELQTNTELANEIESGLNYQLSYGTYSNGMTFSQPVKVDNLVVNTSYSSASNWFAQHIDEVGYITYTTISNVYQLRLYDDNMTSLDYWQTNYGNSYWFISFTAQSNATLTNNDILYRVYEEQVGNSLDSAFYYAIDEMKNNQLFNWTTSTALYTPTAAMTTGMGITTTALPILITYWLYLTAIYIVIDIVIELFTYLTHMITSRIES